MPKSQSKRSKTTGKYHRARIRNFLFTVGPNRLTGGRISRRHLAQDVVVREIEVSSPRWPKGFDGMRIGHVSDFHLGELLPLERALGVAQQLAEQEPDFIACTGDVVDLHNDDAPPLLKALADINAPMGAALVLGNHDELHCPDAITRMGENAGMMVLRNAAARISHNGQTITVAGIDWAKSAVECARNIDTVCSGGAELLLAHNPRAFVRAAEVGIAMTLSGHTHGGQIAVKNRPNMSLALGHRHRAGLYSDGPSRLYVTVGVGAWFPLRVNCPAEIAMITMRHSDESEPAAEEPKPKRGRRKR